MMFIPNVNVGGEKSTAPLGKSALLLSLSAALLAPVQASQCASPEKKPQFRWVLQAVPRTSTLSSFAPTLAQVFVPKTAMARKLWELRQQIVRGGGTFPASSLLASIQNARQDA